MIFNIVDNNFDQSIIDDLYFYYRDQAKIAMINSYWINLIK